MPIIKPGDEFYDKLSDGRYEKCILRDIHQDDPDRHAKARGGTGEIFLALTQEELTPERMDAAIDMILDVELGKFVFLERHIVIPEPPDTYPDDCLDKDFNKPETD